MTPSGFPVGPGGGRGREAGDAALRTSPATPPARNGAAIPPPPPRPTGRLRALIFDVDGTLADTERDGHWVACNLAFAARGLPIRWTWEEYRELLRIPGNQNRMRLALLELGTMGAEAAEAAAADLFRLKQRFYLERVPRLRLRPGVERLVAAADASGVRLAIVSTSSEPQIHALLHHLLPHYEHRFRPVLGQQSGRKVGDAGRLYERCLEELGVPPESALAIEDAEDGFRAARRAGLACVVVPCDDTGQGDFRGAALLTPGLDRVTLAELEALLPAAPAAGPGSGA